MSNRCKIKENIEEDHLSWNGEDEASLEIERKLLNCLISSDL